MNYEEKDSGSSHLKNDPVDPVQKPKKVSIAKIILIICILSTAVFSYMLYKKVSGFLHFLTGEIDAVTAPFKYGNFTTAGPFPLPSDDDDNEGNQMIQQEAPWNAESQSEAEGEEAERIEIPAAESANGSEAALKENSDAYKKSEKASPADYFGDLSEKNSAKTESSADNLTPFPRQLTSFELSQLNKLAQTGKNENTSYEIIKDGIFAGCGRYKMEDGLGRTFFTHKGKNVYKFAFFPAKYLLQDDKERELAAGTAFLTIIKKVYGDKYYEEHKEKIEKAKKSFAKACSETITKERKVAFFENYDFACCADGFAVFSKESEFKKGNCLY